MTAILTDADAIAAIVATPQIGTMVLLSCGDGMTVDGIRDKGDYGRCATCAQFVTVSQAFPVLDI